MIRLGRLPSLVTACAAAFASCTPSAPTLMGNWKHETPARQTETTLSLNPDQTFELDLGGDSVPEILGTYKLNGNEIVFQTSATDGAHPLDPAPGTYRYELSDDSVLFTRLDDRIETRAQEFSRSWKRNQ